MCDVYLIELRKHDLNTETTAVQKKKPTHICLRSKFAPKSICLLTACCCGIADRSARVTCNAFKVGAVRQFLSSALFIIDKDGGNRQVFSRTLDTQVKIRTVQVKAGHLVTLHYTFIYSIMSHDTISFIHSFIYWKYLHV